MMQYFPLDAQPYVEKKYAGWNGVLQAWICTQWNPGGSFISWFNQCAEDFEKIHEGVYLEFTPVSAEAMRGINTLNLPAPDLLFFSPGKISNPDTLVSLPVCNSIRKDLKHYGKDTAIPVALGGYIWALNTVLCDSVPQTTDDLIGTILPADTDGQCFSAALLGLLSGATPHSDFEYSPPDNGIDLGLPVSSANEILSPADILDLFSEGELPYIAADAKMLAKLKRLTDNGKAPDWKTTATGEIACTDQVLLAAIPKRQENIERFKLAQEFIDFLLQEDVQASLADIGSFSVTGKNIHSDFSIYTEMDALLNSRPLWLPACFSEYSVSNSQTIVRRFLSREIDAKNALRLLGFEGM